MLSKVAVVTPVVPPGKVVELSLIISPTAIPWSADVVRVTVVVPLKVKVAPVISVARCVMSNS